MRLVFGHDPNERSEPPPFTVFDFMDGVVGSALADSLGFCESRFQFARIGLEGVDDSLKATVVTGTVFEPSIQPSQPPGRVYVPDGVNELRTAQPGIGDDLPKESAGAIGALRHDVLYWRI